MRKDQVSHGSYEKRKISNEISQTDPQFQNSFVLNA